MKEIILKGSVIHGLKYGRKLGFPTANLSRISYKRKGQNVPRGVYAGFAKLEGVKDTLLTAFIVGEKDKHGLPKLEAHILDFQKNIYGKNLEIKLVEYIRDYMSFASEKDLITQIKKDVIKIRKILENI